MNKKRTSCSKGLVCYVLGFLLIQALIVYSLVVSLESGKQITQENSQQQTVTVDETHRIDFGSTKFIVISDSQTFIFPQATSHAEYSCSKLYKTISVGDQLTISYVERNGLFGKRNVVVAARNNTEIFRTIQAYNNGRDGIETPIYIIFFILETIFLVSMIPKFLAGKNVTKKLCRKLISYISSYLNF